MFAAVFVTQHALYFIQIRVYFVIMLLSLALQLLILCSLCGI